MPKVGLVTGVKS